jgi:hypothetical protein
MKGREHGIPTLTNTELPASWHLPPPSQLPHTSLLTYLPHSPLPPPPPPTSPHFPLSHLSLSFLFPTPPTFPPPALLMQQLTREKPAPSRLMTNTTSSTSYVIREKNPLCIILILFFLITVRHTPSRRENFILRRKMRIKSSMFHFILLIIEGTFYSPVSRHAPHLFSPKYSDAGSKAICVPLLS